MFNRELERYDANVFDKQLCAARAGRQAISEEEVGCDGDAVCITDAVTDNNLLDAVFSKCVFVDCGAVYLAPRFTNHRDILLRHALYAWLDIYRRNFNLVP